MSRLLAGLRIGLLTASASRLGGGVFEAVVNQAHMIRSLGGEVSVFALEDAHSEADSHRLAGCNLSYSRITGPAQIGYAPGLGGSLIAAGLDCLHLHGIWMYPSRAATLWARQTGRGYAISPHGMLDPWITGRGRWKKALARTGYERSSWRHANFFHALTGREAADIAHESRRSDSIIIPNACPQVSVLPEKQRELKIAYIGRVHPKKNLENLVEGWRRAQLPAGARLVIAGWGDGDDVARLEARVNAAGPSVAFIGPAFGAEKRALLESARYMQSSAPAAFPVVR